MGGRKRGEEEGRVRKERDGGGKGKGDRRNGRDWT